MSVKAYEKNGDQNGLDKIVGRKTLGHHGMAVTPHGVLGVGTEGRTHGLEDPHLTKVQDQRSHGKDQDTAHNRRPEKTQPYSGPDPSKRKWSQMKNGWNSMTLIKMNTETHMRSLCRKDTNVIHDVAVSIQK